MSQQLEITRLLEAYAEGDRSALDRLFPLVYDELHRIARGRLARERDGHTLNTTGLIHEAYLELIKFDHIDWRDRAHFFAIASRAMRNILVDYAVQRKARKRGGDQIRVPLELEGSELHGIKDEHLEDLLILNDALERLKNLDERQARIVECRFFGGLTVEETADVLGISPATVHRDWAMARAWLGKILDNQNMA